MEAVISTISHQARMLVCELIELNHEAFGNLVMSVPRRCHLYQLPLNQFDPFLWYVRPCEIFRSHEACPLFHRFHIHYSVFRR